MMKTKSSLNQIAKKMRKKKMNKKKGKKRRKKIYMMLELKKLKQFKNRKLSQLIIIN